MRVMIECVERIGVAQDILQLLAQQQINLEGIELKKSEAKGFIFLKMETVTRSSLQKLIKQISQISGVQMVKSIDYLPQERKNIELLAVLQALPHPVLSLNNQGKIEFANAQANHLLLPLLAISRAKKSDVPANLIGTPLSQLLVNLNRTKWYDAFLMQIATPQANTIQPISHRLQIEQQLWQMEMLPIELWEASQNATENTPLNRPLGCVVSLQLQPKVGLDLRHFMAGQASDFDQIIAQSPKMQEVIEQAKKFATSNAPLLIQGETGTGKDLFAKACHQFSFRRDQKFIAVNCAGLPEQEAESEMFGHRGQGQESIGFFESAHGGTVLLDAVGELSLDMQAKLLRFLNDGSFRRVGEENEIRVDVRIICTTQTPLSVYVQQGKMREDLYHRLNVLTLNIPPLRERTSDIPLLVSHFVEQVSHQLGISPPSYDKLFLQTLQNHYWTGNLRELYNAIYRACSLADQQLNIADLGLPDEPQRWLELPLSDTETTLDDLMNQFEASLLRKFYSEYPSTRKLAQRLGLSHTAVANKLRQYGISKE